MKILINSNYSFLKDYIDNLPFFFEKDGTEIYSGRNLIKVFSINGLKINVKRYGIPRFINRIIYSFFRKPKGLRAYLYPQILLDKGFETPEPIAYIEERRYGIIRYSYFVSIQSPYRFTFYQFGDSTPDKYGDIITAFAHYTARLHEAGILHRDYSPGNILFDKVEGEYHFSLVDINRIHFGKIDIQRGCANFARLWGPISFFKLIAREYAVARHADREFCEKKILIYRKKFWKKAIKKYTVPFNLEL